MAYKFNPYTGNWDIVPDSANNTPSASNQTVTSAPVLDAVPVKDTTVNSQATGSKEFIQVEYNLLTGDAELRPNFNYKANKTINMQGLGKYLSGLYFVDKVTTEFPSDGAIKKTLSVMKNGFGETTKTKTPTALIQLVDDTGVVLSTFSTPTTTVPTAPTGNATPTTPVIVGATASTPPKNVTPTPTVRTHTLAKGETLWSLAVTYYKNGNSWRTIANANHISDAETTKLKIGRVLIIP